MNLRCFYCQTPFTLGRPEMLAALQRMEEENLNHYDAHCPRCRRANSVSRERMELFFPNWRQVAAEQVASTPEPVSVTAPSTESAAEELVPVPAPTAPATSMEEPAMEPEAMKPAAKKHSRKRAGSAKKTKPATTKKTATKATKKSARAKAKTASKPKTKAKPTARKKTASKTKKK